jgi:pSer/pThr/pTyr-binding forkhead associated (FHA) protein
MKARIRVVSGPLAGQTIAVQTKLLVGRDEDCDLSAPCAFLSRHHCVLFFDGCSLRIRDLASKNGTFVNGHHIGANQVILLHDDLVAVGATQFLIELAPLSEEPNRPLTTSSVELKRTAVFDSGTVDDGAVTPLPAEKSQKQDRPLA